MRFARSGVRPLALLWQEEHAIAGDEAHAAAGDFAQHAIAGDNREIARWRGGTVRIGGAARQATARAGNVVAGDERIGRPVKTRSHAGAEGAGVEGMSPVTFGSCGWFMLGT